MSTSIIGLFESNDTARKVVSALTKAGCAKDAIDTLSETGADETTKRLVEAGYDEDKARRYGKAIEKGGVLIVAEVDDATSSDLRPLLYYRSGYAELER